jgi:hypothetical protein
MFSKLNNASQLIRKGHFIVSLNAKQKGIINANIPICYVAAATSNEPCYMQWLIGYDDNQKIETYFKGVFPALKKTEALLKGAHYNPVCRGLRIIPMAISLIAETAAKMNVRWVNTFADATNTPFLRGCQQSGFKPYLLRKKQWFLFHRTFIFLPISDTMNKMYFEVTDAEKCKTRDIHHIPTSNHTPGSISTKETGRS